MNQINKIHEMEVVCPKCKTIITTTPAFETREADGYRCTICKQPLAPAIVEAQQVYNLYNSCVQKMFTLKANGIEAKTYNPHTII